MGKSALPRSRYDRDWDIFVWVLAVEKLMRGQRNAGRYDVEICSIGALKGSELTACVDLLRCGGAVDPNSAACELPLAPVVAIAKSGHEIAGVGAIKRARPDYAKDKAQKSDFDFDPQINELGYVAVADKHRGHGLSHKIIKALLSNHDGPLFATTYNDRMKSTLRKAGFQMKGHEWDGDGGCLSLWVKQV